MSSISEIHREAVLEYLVKSLYSTGIRPSTSSVLQQLSTYFRDNPPGRPLTSTTGTNINGRRSDPQAVNKSMANALLNMGMLYQANYSQGGDLMEINSLLKTYLDKLVVKRKMLTNQIDDYLLSLYNTDGYYFSISDGFSNLGLTSLPMSSAFVDVASNKVTLPITSSLQTNLSTAPQGTVTAWKTANLTDITSLQDRTDLVSVTYSTIGPLGYAFDGLSNTAWGIEIEQDAKSEVIVELSLTLNSLGYDTQVSRVEFDTYGVVPVQIYAEYINAKDSTFKSFGKSIITTDTRAAFLNPTVNASSLRLRMRKTEPDYTVVRNDRTYHKYIFGAKEIYVTRSVYDRQATFVSQPLRVNPDLGSIIDAISLDVTDDTPENTTIRYYVAVDNPEADTTSAFNWTPISPVQALGDDQKVVRFNSTTLLSSFIRRTVEGAGYQLIPEDTVHSDRTKRNPSGTMLANGDVYRVARVGEDFIPETMVLEEGFNTVRILYKPYRAGTYETLENWEPYLSGTMPVDDAFSSIEAGNDFFSGYTVGSAYTSNYVETYLYSEEDRQTLVRECLKTNPAARTWDVKIFLNGEEIADMPEGTHSLPVTWTINKGLNHIAVLVDIPMTAPPNPENSNSVHQPHWGTLDLMRDDSLYNYGTVRLREWNYVDPFVLEEDTNTNPKPNESVRFSVVDGEIVSRVRPTDNFRIKYSRVNGQAPAAIRLKAELTRGTDDPSVTPSIDQYRVRFQYGD